jgi:hypothetical protein
MTSEQQNDRQAAGERKPPKDPHSPAQPLPPSGPPNLNDGPEPLRSTDC